MQGALACMRFSGRGNRNWCGNICCTLLASPPPIRPGLPLGDGGTRVVCATCAVYWKTCLIYGVWGGSSILAYLFFDSIRTRTSERRLVPRQTIKLCKECALKSRKQFRGNELHILYGSKRNWVKSEAKQFNWGKFHTHYELKLNAKRITKVIYPARGLSFLRPRIHLASSCRTGDIRQELWMGSAHEVRGNKWAGSWPSPSLKRENQTDVRAAG